MLQCQKKYTSCKSAVAALTFSAHLQLQRWHVSSVFTCLVNKPLVTNIAFEASIPTWILFIQLGKITMYCKYRCQVDPHYINIKSSWKHQIIGNSGGHSHYQPISLWLKHYSVIWWTCHVYLIQMQIHPKLPLVVHLSQTKHTEVPLLEQLESSIVSLVERNFSQGPA